MREGVCWLQRLHPPNVPNVARVKQLPRVLYVHCILLEHLHAEEKFFTTKMWNSQATGGVNEHEMKAFDVIFFLIYNP